MLWSIGDVAKYLRISKSSVHRLLASGEIRGRKIGGQWRFEPIDVMAESQSEHPLATAPSDSSRRTIAESLMPVLRVWRTFLVELIERVQPTHIIACDRRAKKILDLFGLVGFTAGKTLWQSTALRHMTDDECRALFDGSVVLVFDEMVKHARELAELRVRLTACGANVVTAACARKRSIAVKGLLKDPDLVVAEDLSDGEFAERGTAISALTSLFQLPLDADHIVIRLRVNSEVNEESLLTRLAQFGIPFIIWHASQGVGEDSTSSPTIIREQTMAITLDRPQFFNVGSVGPLFEGLSFDWNGPIKLRLYINWSTRECFCTFIVYPAIDATELAWQRVPATLQLDQDMVKGDFVDEQMPRDRQIKRLYSIVCLELALALLRDLVRSGAAKALGLDYSVAAGSIDVGAFKSAFGPTLGNRLAEQVRHLVVETSRSVEVPLFPKPVLAPPLWIRRDSDEFSLSHDTFACRASLLPKIPTTHFDGATTALQEALSFDGLVQELRTFSQSTIGRVIDFEMDCGTTKPDIVVTRPPTGTLLVRRIPVRGEFGSWFEWRGSNTQLTKDDNVILNSLGLGQAVTEEFIRHSPKALAEGLTGTQFNKVFANLQHDWPDQGIGQRDRSRFHDRLYLGWKPYKYGPIPVVPPTAPGFDYEQYHKFLTDRGAIVASKTNRGWIRYSGVDEDSAPFTKAYLTLTPPAVRSNIRGLVKLYAKLESFEVTRPRSTRGGADAVSKDAIVVLSAARNERIAYICGWFEVEDWRMKANVIFAELTGWAGTNKRPVTPFLRDTLSDFAEPARLLYEKIEMYRSIPQVRDHLKILSDEFPAADIVLSTTDEVPVFSTNSMYPVGNLEWASNVMRAFSSLTRQIAAQCGYDTDRRRKRTDEQGTQINDRYFLMELLDACPELRALEAQLTRCIDDSHSGLLSRQTVDGLRRALAVILSQFELPGRIPDPRPEFEIRRSHMTVIDGLVSRFREVNIADPYAIAVADIRNLQNLPLISDIIGRDSDDAMGDLLEWAQTAVNAIKRDFPSVHCAGLCADNVILAGRDANDVFRAVVRLIEDTSRRLIRVDRNQFQHFGLFRVGIAWHEEARGEEFSTTEPGLVAFTVGDKRSLPAGHIAVTDDVYRALAPEIQQTFAAAADTCKQGTIWDRRWIVERDGPHE